MRKKKWTRYKEFEWSKMEGGIFVAKYISIIVKDTSIYIYPTVFYLTLIIAIFTKLPMNKPKYIDTKNRRRKMGWEKNNNRPWKTNNMLQSYEIIFKSHISIILPYLCYWNLKKGRIDVFTVSNMQANSPFNTYRGFFILPSRPGPSIIMTTWVISAGINLAQGQPNSVLFQPILSKRYIKIHIYIL